MKNIILLAYAISPYRGSEYAVAWNHILNIAKDNKLTVIYGTSGDHIGDFVDMDKYLSQNKVENVTFVQIKPSKYTTALNWLNENNIFNYSFYLAYKRWQFQVYKEVQKLIRLNQYDLIHFLCPIGYREPGYLWKLNVPYIWGPICGVNNIPWKLFKIMSLKGGGKYFIRNIINSLQFKYNHRFKESLKRVNLLLTATTETQNRIKTFYKKESFYIPENAILENPQINTAKFNFDNIDDGKYQLIFVGRLDDGKGTILCLKALKQIKNKRRIHLNVIGDGPLKSYLEEYVKKNDLHDIVTFYGKLPRAEVLNKYNEAHLHIITSLSEANTTVIWEAMAHGVPTLALDHCGMHDVICSKCGIKIGVTNSEQIVADISKEIDALIEHPERFESLAKGTIECANKYTWEKRRKQMNAYYNLAIENSKQTE